MSDTEPELPPVEPSEEPSTTAPHPWIGRTRARAVALQVWAVENRSKHSSIDASFQLAERDQRMAASVLAGGIAVRLFFWLLPVVLILASVLGFVSRSSPTATSDGAEELGLADAAVDAVATASVQAEQGRWALLVVGLWLILWTGYTSVRALRLVHALAWRERPTRLANPLKATLAFSGAALVFTAIPAVAGWLREVSHSAGLAVTLLSVGAFFAVWLWASWQLPHGDAPWRALLPGALLFAVVAQAMHLFVALYVTHKLERASELYGGLGVAATFLFVFYIGGRLIVGSAVLNSTLWERKQAVPEAPPPTAGSPFEPLAEDAAPSR